MFYGCDKITSIEGLNNWYTAYCENMEGMFKNCVQLKTIPKIQNWNVTKVKKMNEMFCNCNEIVDITLYWDTNSLVSLNSMFSGCSKVDNISISGFNITHATDKNNIISQCYNLNQMCVPENDDIEQEITSLWGRKPVFVEKCYKKNNINVCPSSNFKEEMNSRLLSLGLKEGVDFFWYAIENDKSFFIMKINSDDCNLSCKKLYVNNESIFKGLTKIESITFLQEGSNKLTTMEGMFANCRNLKYTNLDGIDTQYVTSIKTIFLNCQSLQSLITNKFNTEKVTTMSRAFEGCENLEQINLEKIKTHNVEDMSYMFKNCKKISYINLSLFNTSKVTNMAGMFEGCNNVIYLDLTSFQTSNVTNISSMFKECQSLKTIFWNKNFNTENVVDMVYLFYDCYSLQNIDLTFFNTSKTKNIGGMFTNCKSLTSVDLSNFDTKNVTNMSFMFYGCHSLNRISITNFNVSKVTIMDYMFAGSGALKEIYLWHNSKTDSLTSMKYMFYGCAGLTKLNLENFNTQKVTDMSYCFYHCTSLRTLDISSFSSNSLTTIDFMFAQCSGLTHIISSKNNFTPSINVSAAGIFTNDISLTKVCMNLNYKIYENLISLWGQSITLQDGCYIKKTNLYSSIQASNDKSIAEKKSKKTYNIAKRMILQNIQTQENIKGQKEYIHNIFNGTTQINNNTLPILMNVLQYKTSNNSLYLP